MQESKTRLARISVLMPTRHRLEQAERCIASLVETATHPEALEIVVYVDDDDPESHALDRKDIAFHKIVGPRLNLGALNTACLSSATGDILGAVNDDVVVRTQGWDDRLRAIHDRFPDGIYLAYPNDLFFGPRMASFPFMARATCDALGDPFPAEYPGDFQDHHLLDLFQRLRHHGHDRIVYMEDVVMEHLHVRFGNEKDEPEMYNGRTMGEGDHVFLALHPHRKRLTRRLQAVIEQKPLPPVPATPRIRPLPESNIVTGCRLMVTFLLDGSLPFCWRWFLFTFFGKLYWIKKYRYPQPRWQYTLLKRLVDSCRPSPKPNARTREP
ncbi:glycosyltransferase family 2 protein [Nitrospina sp. 32_T5]